MTTDSKLTRDAAYDECCRQYPDCIENVVSREWVRFENGQEAESVMFRFIDSTGGVWFAEFNDVNGCEWFGSTI